MLFFSTIMSMIAAGSLFLGLYIFLQGRNNPLNRLFCFIFFIVSLWHIIAVIGYSSPSCDRIVTATVFATFIYMTFITANLHVGIHLSKQRMPTRMTVLLLYAPAFLFTAFVANDPAKFFRYTRHEGAWKFSPAYESPWFYMVLGLIVAYSAAFILLLAARRNNAGSNRQRRQLDVILGAFIATSIMVGVTQFIVPRLRLYVIPDIGPSGHALYLFGLYYAVFRLRFMSRRLAVSADELIAHISDMVFITDRDANIASMNGPARRTIHGGGAIRGGVCLFDVIRDRASIRALFDRLSSGEAESVHSRITYSGVAGDVFTDSYVSRIMDGFSDHVGFLVISSENRGKAMLQSAYRITEREFEVIGLCVSGSTNREMARSLAVSVRTVETHLLNIYNKLGINNKIELLNVAIQFGLVPGVAKTEAEPGTGL
ncbi:MAG: hypothetical protein JXA20_18130 [Spirochaetes bacterium]|nr:hypothetical protein [Spirochaetota bacterium]